MKKIAKSLFLEVIDEFVRQMATDIVHAVNIYLDNDKRTAAEFIHASLPLQIRYRS